MALAPAAAPVAVLSPLACLLRLPMIALPNTVSDPVITLETRVLSALTSSPYLATTRVRIEAGDGEVRLHGHVGSFFEKQMAQEAVRQLDGVERIENLLEVDWS